MNGYKSIRSTVHKLARSKAVCIDSPDYTVKTEMTTILPKELVCGVPTRLDLDPRRDAEIKSLAYRLITLN